MRKEYVIILMTLPLIWGDWILPPLKPRHRSLDMAAPCAVPRTSDESPYYFGTSDLACITTKGRFHLITKRSIQMDPERNRTKRAAPKRHVLAPTHRWIYYKGFFFEWGTDAGTKNRLFGFLNDAKSYSIKSGLPYKADKCNWMLESLPAGYSSVPAECIMGCTANYRTVTGDYSLLNNNCHHFANTISNILCSNICPEWCTTPL